MSKKQINKKKISVKLTPGETAIVLGYDTFLHIAETYDYLASQEEKMSIETPTMKLQIQFGTKPERTISSSLKMKKITPGEWRKWAKIAVATGIGVAIFLGRKSSIKKLEASKANPSIHQYLNRLVEFFDAYSIDKAQDEFLPW